MCRWRPNVIIGSTADLPRRPTIVLAPKAKGFDDPKKPKNVLKITNTGRENDNMNQVQIAYCWCSVCVCSSAIWC